MGQEYLSFVRLWGPLGKGYGKELPSPKALSLRELFLKGLCVLLDWKSPFKFPRFLKSVQVCVCCVVLCMYVCVHVHTCVSMCVEIRGHSQVSSLGTLSTSSLSLAWSSPRGLDCLVTESQRSSCLRLPSAGLHVFSMHLNMTFWD